MTLVFFTNSVPDISKMLAVFDHCLTHKVASYAIERVQMSQIRFTLNLELRA